MWNLNSRLLDISIKCKKKYPILHIYGHFQEVYWVCPLQLWQQGNTDSKGILNAKFISVKPIKLVVVFPLLEPKC